ncbi:hypothetical protein OHA77_07765 [Streptosporangium sp. NBC_01639]|uniref:hypothetical protein n=1 Tax=Streptosporangium sp. NBC_01639 TaxID=2975948 RepID=UPI00386E90B0|nr:hypothetical protein OHA77_07765 [Streptosporangium sp. NBC_01639]
MIGSPIEGPSDSSTSRGQGPLLSPFTRTLTGPPGRWLLPLVAFAGLVLLYGVSAPGGYFMETMFGGFLGLVLVIVWAPRFVVALCRADGRPGLRRHWTRWAAAPLMGVAVIGLVHFDVPYTARFALSETSLERYAQAVAAGTEPEIQEKTVGLFSLASIERTGTGARFRVRGTGFLSSYGFAWSPGGEPSGDYEGEYEHLRGHWYEWMEGSW